MTRQCRRSVASHQPHRMEKRLSSDCWILVGIRIMKPSACTVVATPISEFSRDCRRGQTK